MNKSQQLLIIFLVAVVGALWLLMFNFSMIPAHSRDVLGTQAAPLE